MDCRPSIERMDDRWGCGKSYTCTRTQHSHRHTNHRLPLLSSKRIENWIESPRALKQSGRPGGAWSVSLMWSIGQRWSISMAWLDRCVYVWLWCGAWYRRVYLAAGGVGGVVHRLRRYVAKKKPFPSLEGVFLDFLWLGLRVKVAWFQIACVFLNERVSSHPRLVFLETNASGVVTRPSVL